MTKSVKIANIEIGAGAPLALIAGPCVIESLDGALAIAKILKEFSERDGVPLIFKASYDKANRSSLESYRGPGLVEGLKILEEIKAAFGLPIVTDVHAVTEVDAVAKVADMIQIPAFLCRQTDLLVAVAKTGKPVNVKKGQFLAPADVSNLIAKIEQSGNDDILITERGTTYGYNNLVVDMRAIPMMKEFGYPVIFDATHSVQMPGGKGTCSGGDAKLAPYLAKSAVAAGCDAVFVEVHTDPETALCDGANSIELSVLPEIWNVLRRINEVV